MAHPSAAGAPLALPGWKAPVGWICALLLSVLFISSGGWKILYPIDWAARITQMQIPGVLALPAAVGVGIAELFGAVLILIPRFRRWGAWLLGFLLLVFMAYFALKYNVLRGEECSCFPWLKRTVGPAFFISDAAMLGAAFLAGKFARRAEGLKSAGMVLGAIAVFAGVSLGVTMTQQKGLKAPDTVQVNGQPYSLASGRIFLYFFDPECAHCFEAAKRMTTYHWRDIKIVGIPTRVPNFAGQFLNDTGLKADITSDQDKLREVFKFNDPPYAVLLENGRQKQAFIQFDDKEPAGGLKSAGAIE